MLSRWLPRSLPVPGLRSRRRADTSTMLSVPRGHVRLPDGRRTRVPAFRLDATPVTNAEYAAFVRATGHFSPAWMHRPGFCEPDQPVVGITLADALAYARWAGKRLPTAREWVRAARGDDARPYPWGDAEPQAGLAWIGLGARGAPAAVGDPSARRAGAGPFGHRDLVGNVWEWCADGCLRGGFWGSQRAAIDDALEDRPDRVSAGYGLRCAL